MENSESSANEQNSLNDSHSVSEIKSVTSNEKLGVSNDNEVLTGGYESGKTYSHDYNYPFWVNDAKTFLSHFKHVTKGMYGEGRNDIIVYWTPLESTSNGQYRMYLVYDTSDVSKIHKHTVGSRNKNTADGFVSFELYGGTANDAITNQPIPGTNIIIGSTTKWFVGVITTTKAFVADTPIDAAYEMVCWLLENNLIKKGGQD